MNHTLLVGVSHAVRHLNQDVDEPGQWILLLGLRVAGLQGKNDVPQIPPFHLLHGKEQIALTIPAQLITRHGSGMLDVGGHPCFTHKPRRLNVAFAQVIVKRLVNHHAMQILVHAAGQLGRAAFSKTLVVSIFERAALPVERKCSVHVLQPELVGIIA